jgi:hypothetical protein
MKFYQRLKDNGQQLIQPRRIKESVRQLLCGFALDQLSNLAGRFWPESAGLRIAAVDDKAEYQLPEQTDRKQTLVIAGRQS